MTDDQRIAEIQARCEAATPGPWHTTVDGNECYIDINEDESVGSVFYESDADFITHSSEDIPYLLSELERTQAELAAEKAKYAELQQYNIDCTKQAGALLVERQDLRVALAQAEKERGAAACCPLCSRKEDYQLFCRGQEMEMEFCAFCGAPLNKGEGPQEREG